METEIITFYYTVLCCCLTMTMKIAFVTSPLPDFILAAAEKFTHATYSELEWLIGRSFCFCESVAANVTELCRPAEFCNFGATLDSICTP